MIKKINITLEFEYVFVKASDKAPPILVNKNAKEENPASALLYAYVL